ncbi:hypothetical protein HORM4_470021 [Vibrio harveyi]|nr:hypothetical protein HORM4_470021 [Vibrio harveyi]
MKRSVRKVKLKQKKTTQNCVVGISIKQLTYANCKINQFPD